MHGRASSWREPSRGTGGLGPGRETSGGAWLRARRLLVIRADNIGDVVMTGPALKAIRRTLPDAVLTLLASPAGAQAAPLLPWIDDVINCRVLWQDLGRLPLCPEREWGLIERLRQGRFDGAIILTSFSQSPHAAAFAAWLAGIPLRAGASRERSEYLTDAVPFGAFAQHQVERNAALVRALGFPVGDTALDVRVPADARRRAAQLLAARGLSDGEPFMLWSPWASAPARTWRPERAADAARRAADAAGLRVVVTAHERNAAEAVTLAERIGPAAIDLSGATTVAELAALVAAARLVITNHTLVMHLADALRTPAVVLFSGTDLESQWAPRAGPRVLLRKPTGCSPCYELACPFGHECLDFEPPYVADAALGLLAASRRGPAQRPQPALREQSRA